jgi:hypothetical protein
VYLREFNIKIGEERILSVLSLERIPYNFFEWHDPT